MNERTTNPDGAPKVTSSELCVRARVQGVDPAGFEQQVERAAELSPVSNALRGNIEISVRSELER